MAGRIIQGFFIGGAMRPQPPQRAAAAEAPPPHSTGAPPPAFARRSAPLQARMAPGRPPLVHQGAGHVAQRHGGNGSFEIDPVQLGLARGGGKPLPQAVLAKMEAAFGADFAAVRVHVGPQASRIGAVAFTTGNDLYFAPGRFQPDSVQGQQLIGHELAHVIQQRQGRVRAPGSGVAVVQDRMLEAEADRLGMRAAQHVMASPPVARLNDVAQPKLLSSAGALGRYGTMSRGTDVRRTGMVQRSAMASPSSYVLSGDKYQATLEKLGQFTFYQGFLVTPAVAGVVIQRIRRKLIAYDVWGQNHKLLTTADVEKFPDSQGKFLLTGWDDYYECFEVDAKGKSKYLDGFILTQINPDKHTSAGQYEISGEAYFVPGPVQLGGDWQPGNKKNPANGLPFIQNAAKASSASLPAPQSAVLKRTVTVTWYKSDHRHLKLDGQKIDSKGWPFPADAPIKP